MDNTTEALNLTKVPMFFSTSNLKTHLNTNKKEYA